MYIEEIILDGFKSYATKTVVGPFHRQFNAITGLNGTGKSNILDSICFVMGIKSLAQMRVSKVDELVYKQGQAGVTKASVTLVFNNTDKDSSPPMVRHLDRVTITRQIIIGGRDRHLLNSHNAKQSEILNLFHSVQLNVNNPHFLIMQGRITKVINMKPKELLSMIEEASGTRMYESKKIDSLKRIEKKQLQLNEIDRIVNEEIRPTLDRLASERNAYVKWTHNNEEIDKLSRYTSAFKYFCLIRKIEKNKAEIDKLASEHDTLAARSSEWQREVEELSLEIAEKQKKLDKGHQRPVIQFKDQLKDIDSEIGTINTNLEDAQKTLNGELSTKKKLEDKIASIEKEIEKLNSSSAKQQSDLDKHRTAVSSCENEVEGLKDELKTLQTGNVTKSSHGSQQSLRGMLIEAQTKVTEMKGEVEMKKMQLAQKKKDLKKLQAQSQGQSKEGCSLRQEVEAAERQVEEIAKQIENTGFNPIALSAIRTELKEVESEMNGANEVSDRLKSKFASHLSVHHEFPEREEVFGPAFELMKIKENQSHYSVALEVAGGGKLFYVLVKDDGVAKAVFDRYKTSKRVTCIPLNRIKGTSLARDRVLKAKDLVGCPPNKTDVCAPLDIVDLTSGSFLSAFQYIFGPQLLCKTGDMAQKVSHDPTVKAAAITQSGDSYNPSGGVTGGSTAGLNNLLLNFAEYLTQYAKVIELKEKRDALSLKLTEASECQSAASKLCVERETEEIKLKGLKARYEAQMQQSVEGKVQLLEKEIPTLEAEIIELTDAKIPEMLTQTIPTLEEKISQFSDSREERIGVTQKNLDSKKVDLKKLSKKLETVEESMKDVTQKFGVLSTQKEDNEAQLKDIDDSVKQAASEVEKLNTLHAAQLELRSQVASRLADAEAQLIHTSSHITALTKQRDEVEEKVTAATNELQLLSHRASKEKAEHANSVEDKKAFSSRITWLKGIEAGLNKPGGEFDFESGGKDKPHESIGKLDKLQKEQEELSKRIRKQVMEKFDKAEAEFKELELKRQQVMKDKDSIADFIQDLDVKKKIALEITWNKVNEHFSSIFSTLLPSAEATLAEPEGQTFMDGLEMKVALGGVWKASLGELSGGQRSLLALSLILALLRFKPAPVYILDEVDAALDLSHTQNIGQMIKSHFPDSQFIIVSLKENLFNYADVLFRTQFTDGVSAVVRKAAKKERDEVVKKTR
eukprot:GHVN01006262.1.p1 GENE.GHVN01006262.1~~GHVN01006262.1.p1  ORF type:complete len:1196 (+),score=302.88 GHVN01006262.1:281-3868(+)